MRAVFTSHSLTPPCTGPQDRKEFLLEGKANTACTQAQGCQVLVDRSRPVRRKVPRQGGANRTAVPRRRNGDQDYRHYRVRRRRIHTPRYVATRLLVLLCPGLPLAVRSLAHKGNVLLCLRRVWLWAELEWALAQHKVLTTEQEEDPRGKRSIFRFVKDRLGDSDLDDSDFEDDD